jgi:hypothetical protein
MKRTFWANRVLSIEGLQWLQNRLIMLGHDRLNGETLHRSDYGLLEIEIMK